MQRLSAVFSVLAVSACASRSGGYMRAEVVYAEPPVRVYAVPVDRVVIISRDVLVRRGYTVYRVENHGANRTIWARRGDDEVVRVFLAPQGTRVAVRGVVETRDHGRHNGWVRHGTPHSVVKEIDVRIRAH
jgi:hypothetical protein